MQLCQLSAVRGKYSEALSLASDAYKDFQEASDQRGMLWSELQAGVAQICTGQADAGVSRIAASARKLSQFELVPHALQGALELALTVCSDGEKIEYLHQEV
jgi:hypothetical protein